ncbi:F0F1 ATP synthase subunit A [Aestuariivivens sediminis]|uniref:F0F1 ATP synthase subunit A n=1 Tax=Aestuariivivens sediminis TaxID=2913557 RepID=UPI001F592F21|nr:F0F1 ATP synthase subunit A [Aestuariivivens sediminis]
MHRKIALKPIALVLFLLSMVSYGKDQHGHEEPNTGKTTEVEVKEYIQHHLKDSYDFNLFSYKTDAGEEKHIGFPLPVILWDNGLKVFSSSRFHHGEAVAEVDGNFYKLHHSKIYRVESPEGEIIEDEHQHPINERPLDFSITKNVVMIFMMFALMLFMFRRMAMGYKLNGRMPRGMGRFLEPIVLYIRDEIAIPNIGEKHYKRYMSYLLTVFFFVWIVNLFGLTPIGMNLTNNIAVTLCLALITYVITTFSGNKNYWKHIFWMPGVPVPMKIILAPIELLGTFIKPFALMIRLYANITAGHVVLMSIIGMVFLLENWLGSSLSFLLAFVLAILELLVAALQAYIFTVLSALYFGMAVEEHDHH